MGVKDTLPAGTGGVNRTARSAAAGGLCSPGNALVLSCGQRPQTGGAVPCEA